MCLIRILGNYFSHPNAYTWYIPTVGGLELAVKLERAYRSVLVYVLCVTTLPAADFPTTVKPFLTRNCYACHNDRNPSGGLDILPFTAPTSIGAQREEWERIVHKIRTGEMPPKPMKRPPQAAIDTVLAYLQGEFEREDKKTPPDPGRVTARRLNRVEYANTIRDVLGVDFRAEQDFPSDDSGHGFDNIGDVLTISPVLMEKYMIAAERIASRAIGADPLPKPIEADYHSRDKRIKRLDRSTIEARHRVEFDGEYIVRIGMPGQRGADGKPVEFRFWIDGKVVHTQQVETKPSKLVYFEPYSEEEFRLVLTEGEHVFRAGFVNDDFVAGLTDKQAYNTKSNKFLNMIKFIGPYPMKERPSRERIVVCDPNTGPACVNRILSAVARRAWRRPVTTAEVSSLARFVDQAKQEGLTAEQGLQVAIQAMLVSPHFLFRIEHHPESAKPGQVHSVSDIELASRLSYFLWSSAPDDELLALAESGKLGKPGVMDAQVKRMIADPRAVALAENFAGQWLETRNLDMVKPDPQKFPQWNDDLKLAMKAETRLFFEHILKGNRPITEFLNANYTFLNDTLAEHYGIDGVQGADFRKVDLTGDQRGGVLSHASVLTVSSYPTRTSPVIRGKYVLQNILGTPPPPPPPDVPSLDEEAVGTAGSVRQQLEKHRSNSTCASCHERMDTLGFGLENFDAIGRWRSADGKFPIDASGTFPNGKSFSTPAEMRTLLMNDLPEFTRCLTEKMLTYSLGRGLERYDRRTVNTIATALTADGLHFQTLIHQIVNSLPFRSTRSEVLRTQDSPQRKEIAHR